MLIVNLFFAYEASCPDNQLKLIGGKTEQEGRVEICYNQRWKTLDFYRWSPSVAKVTCVELGFSSNIVNL